MSPMDEELRWEVDRSGLELDKRTQQLLDSEDVVEEALGCIRLALIAQGLNPDGFELTDL